MPKYPNSRQRRLRVKPSSEALFEEFHLDKNDFIQPFLIADKSLEGDKLKLCGREVFGLDGFEIELNEIQELGIKAIYLSTLLPESKKDPNCNESWNPNGLLQQAIQKAKLLYPDITVISELSLEAYNSNNYNSIIDENGILNDTSINILAKIATSHARSGADFVMSSGSLDGETGIIREILEVNGFHETGIISGTGIFDSIFNRKLNFNSESNYDKKKYMQYLNPINKSRVKISSALAIEEGADAFMVKPAIQYLDIISNLHSDFDIPVIAFHTLWEMLLYENAYDFKWFYTNDLLKEQFMCMKRAGARAIISYGAKSYLKSI